VRARLVRVGLARTVSRDYNSTRCSAEVEYEVADGDDVAAVYEVARAACRAELTRQEDEMAVIPRGQYPVIESGAHYLRFVGAMTKRLKPLQNEQPDGPDGLVGKIEMVFESSKRADSGKFQTLEYLCSAQITPRNKLGKLAVLMSAPGFDPGTHDFDPDLFEGLLYKAYITHEVSEAGKTVPKLAELTYYGPGKSGRAGLPPLVSSAPAVAHPSVQRGTSGIQAPSVAVQPDPFADEAPAPAPSDDPFADD
jgi:hypothetical protein